MPQHLSIPKSVIRGKWAGSIPPSVAEFSEEEEKNLKINFYYYNNDVCQINLMGKKAKNALLRIKIIGQSTRSGLTSNGIQLEQVRNEGDYKKLFKSNLPNSFTDSMKEHKFSDTCRIFCVLDGDVCNVIAITLNHLETNKHR